MKGYSIIIYIILSIILNFILNKLEEEKENNFYDYIVVSNIYILILSGIFSHHSNNIFLVILFQVMGNILYITYVKEIPVLNNNIYNISKYLLSILIAYLLNINFVNKVDSIFLNEEQLKLIIWIFITCYLYFSFKDNFKLKVTGVKTKKFYQDEEYIVMQYAKNKYKYNNFVNSKNKEINLLVYAIMIYENYNRPKLLRKYDEIKYNIFSKKGKFGIMQINSNEYINDIESINLTIKKKTSN